MEKGKEELVYVREEEMRRKEKREGGGPAGDCFSGNFWRLTGINLAGDFCMVTLTGVRRRSVSSIESHNHYALLHKEKYTHTLFPYLLKSLTSNITKKKEAYSSRTPMSINNILYTHRLNQPRQHAQLRDNKK